MKNYSIARNGLLKSLLTIAISMSACPNLQAQQGDTVYADIAAIDQPFMLNRLGAAQPTGKMFVLKSDLERIDTTKKIAIGNYRLRADKRPRPIVLRANVGNVLKIRFTNLLAPYYPDGIVNSYNTDIPGTVTQSWIANSNGQEGMGDVQVTRKAGIHIKGMELAISNADDGSFVGNNDSSIVSPNRSITYTLLVTEEGAFMLYSTGADVDNQQVITGSQLTDGLFGTLNVEPPYAEWYRSQVSQADLDLAISGYWRWSVAGHSDTSVTWIQKGTIDIYDSTNTFPAVNYNATFKSGPKTGWPVLKMYDSLRPHFRELVYTDLTAIITGPNHGRFPDSIKSESFSENPATPDRRQPYREFSIHYHELAYAVQAFSNFSTLSPLNGMLTPGLDQFAINYGTGGIAAEIYANRIGVGPMAHCADCAYEEFFLSAWAVGDPAMVVDIPANATGTSTTAIDTTLQNQFLGFETVSSANLNLAPDTGYKATKVLYPDDPSNVYHSYMNDHCTFRITHAGMGLPHVHHQHAAQWLHSPNSADSHYMDSQTIMPGSSYSLDMVYGGSGNLNKTVGDMIFHCHFYPHFAAGMWSMWRVHDVLELGTKIDAKGRAVAGARALPDAEIHKGTLIPGLVPLPTVAMAPVPARTAIDTNNGQVVILNTTKSPGYPFFIPGIAGTRAPNPPLDFAKDTLYGENRKKIDNKLHTLDGGLPRGMILDAHVAFERHTKYDWTKIINNIKYIQLPDSGTRIEQIAMATHAQRNHPTVTPEGRPGDFVLNGRPPVAGAPYADPAVDAKGNPIPGKPRVYKAAVIQLDAVFNKKGWHYPQQRMESLWDDVKFNINGTKAPEPLFVRANSTEVVEFWHTNLVPEYYELDDYQVRTPTDVIGQHIHLVKFDVTASDGAVNGFNYEDGTLSPDVVRERINAINNGGVHYNYDPAIYNPAKPLTATSQYSVVPIPLVPTYPNPRWGKAPSGQDWSGAQTTIQRWYADPLLNTQGKDRTLTTVFTHDHFGPSTHQQVGLYAGLLIEPEGSTWKNASTGETLGKRNDGGPTTWAANIIGTNAKNSYREFMLEFQDNQQAYLPASKGHMPYPYPVNVEDLVSFNDSVAQYIDSGNGGWIDQGLAVNPPGSPELISAGGRGTFSLSYRNEPVPLRVSEPNGDQAPGDSGNLAYVFASMKRFDPAFNSQPSGWINSSDTSDKFAYPKKPIGPGMQPTDPYTPLLRAYENDSIQIRTLVGAHVTTHYFNVHGVNWLFEPTYSNSGYRSTQEMGLSEHFEMNFKIPATPKSKGDSSFTDYLYNASSDMNGLTAGLWGLMRAYDTPQDSLTKLPGNNKISYVKQDCGCPPGARVDSFQVTAINVSRYINANHIDSVVYNKYDSLYDNTALVFMLDSDLMRFKTDPEYVVEPLVLRARAGDCIKLKLTNGLKADSSLLYSSKTNYSGSTKNPTESFPNIDLTTSATVGLHAELLSYDARKSDGTAVGFNNNQTADIGRNVTYYWYAGKWIDGNPVPVEFGSVPLSAPDPLYQPVSGLIGALIVEPENSHWYEDPYSHWTANVYNKNNSLLFREFVMQFQDNLSILQGSNANQWKAMAINYKTEPLMPILNQLAPSAGGQFDFADISGYFSSSALSRDPVTPHMYAGPGQPLRIRLVNSGGSGPGEVFNLDGHVWQEEPYANNGQVLGSNPKSQWFGFRDQLGALNSFDILIDKAGGNDSVTGDYFYNSSTNQSLGFAQGVNGGLWGILTVKKDWIDVANADIVNDKATIAGLTYVLPGTNNITLSDQASGYTKSITVDPAGAWTFGSVKYQSLDDLIKFTTSAGGYYSTTLREMMHLQAQRKTRRVQIANYKARPHDFSRGVEPTTERSIKK